MRILFMGTPDFALFSLRALVDSGEDVIGVVTQTDKPRGRGKQMLPPPVKVYAEEHGIPVFQPKTLKNGAFLPELEALSPELIVVTAFGKILPPEVLTYPKYGCLNVHASLLPAYRGAAPMQRAILDGQRETGVTIMYMDDGIDTGDMMLRRTVPIGENDNFEKVHDALGAVGAEALIEGIALLKAGKAPREKQPEEGMTYAAKIGKEDCLIDFTNPATVLHNQIRGLSPFPLAYLLLSDGKLLKVAMSEVGTANPGGARPGTVLELGNADGSVTVACGEGSVKLLRVIPEGKKPMDALSFARGRGLKPGMAL